jgi:Cu-Zn family superoxide dismutase
MRIALTAALSAGLLTACGAAMAPTAQEHAHHAAADSAGPAARPVARAMLKTADGADAGTVTAYRGPLGLLFRIEGRNWPAGWHATHLHAVGRCDTPDFTSAGGHVNHAQARPHGLLNTDGGPDLGDLQNVFAHHDGAVHAEVYLSGAGLGMRGQDLLDADGLSFLVHANPDDHVTQPIGGAGARIACGVFEAAE